MKNLSRSGQPPTSSTEIIIAKVKEMVTENRHLTLREIAAELSVFHESVKGPNSITRCAREYMVSSGC